MLEADEFPKRTAGIECAPRVPLHEHARTDLEGIWDILSGAYLPDDSLVGFGLPNGLRDDDEAGMIGYFFDDQAVAEKFG